MEPTQTYSAIITTSPGNNLLKTSSLVFLLAVNPAKLPAYPTVMSLASQIHPWEEQLHRSQSSIPVASTPNEGLSDIYVKPAPVRRYKVKARVRSIRRGTIR